MVGVIFSLLVLSLVGMSVLVLPYSVSGLALSETSGLPGLWWDSITLFAVPLSLIPISFLKYKLIRMVSIFWGVWLVVLSLSILFNLQVAPEITLYGKALVGVGMLFALALVLFASILFIKSFRPAVFRESDHPPT